MAANAVKHAANHPPPPAARPPGRALQRWLRQHAFWLVVVLALGLVVIGSEFGRLTVDTRPEIYLDPWRATREALSAWSSVPGLGQASFQVGLAPVSALVGVLQGIGLPAWLSVRVLRWALMIVAAGGMWRLTSAVQGAGQLWARRAAVVAFVANPYVVAAGATLPVLWPYALLPWQVWSVLRAMATGRWLGWAVVFGLVTAAMTGQNAGAVPALQLVALPVALLWGARVHGRSPRVALGFLFSGGAIALALSAYWLLPSLAAVGSGSTIVGESESLAAISQTSSFAEVIRGMGLWPLYGRTGADPWVAAHAALLTSPLVVVAGFLLPLTAWLLVRRVPRAVLRFPVALVAVAALVMVGVHPDGSPSPVGRLWRWLLETLPPLGVLRTTNKAGAVLVLGVALLVALGVATARWPRLAAATVVVVALVSSLPGWTGGLYTSRVDVPQYWRDASRSLATAPGRVWLLPGETSANYRWSDPRPDDVGQSLIAPETLVRTTVPNTSAQGTNLLAAVDRRLQEGTLPPALLAVAARYLGVSTIVVRNDVVWEQAGGAGPHTVSDEVRGSTGLVLSGSFGEPTAASGGEPQLAVYTVQQPNTVATLAPTDGRLVVAGDGNAVPSLATLGYLDGQPTIEYASDLTAEQLAEVADDGGRVVLTDTNRREATVAGRLTEDHGPILAADRPVRGTGALGGPSDQSVRVPRGWTATADTEGSVFRPLPWASADNAVDGDPSTAWFAGDYGGAVGRVLAVDFHEAMPPGRLQVSTVGIGTAAVTGVSVTANGDTYDLVAEGEGVFGVDVPAPVAAVELEITGVVPQAPENVGITEVSWSGAVSDEPDSVRTPRTLSDLVNGLSGDRRRELSSVPTDVVLGRVPGGVRLGLEGGDQPVARRGPPLGHALERPRSVHGRRIDGRADAGRGGGRPVRPPGDLVVPGLRPAHRARFHGVRRRRGYRVVTRRTRDRPDLAGRARAGAHHEPHHAHPARRGASDHPGRGDGQPGRAAVGRAGGRHHADRAGACGRRRIRGTTPAVGVRARKRTRQAPGGGDRWGPGRPHSGTTGMPHRGLHRRGPGAGAPHVADHRSFLPRRRLRSASNPRGRRAPLAPGVGLGGRDRGLGRRRIEPGLLGPTLPDHRSRPGRERVDRDPAGTQRLRDPGLRCRVRPTMAPRGGRPRPRATLERRRIHRRVAGGRRPPRSAPPCRTHRSTGCGSGSP